MINRIKEMFKTNPKSMWTISFLVLTIFIFTPAMLTEYQKYQHNKMMADFDSNFNWKEIQRTQEENKRLRSEVADTYDVTFSWSEEGEDMREDGTMFPTRWLWFKLNGTTKAIAFNYNGKLAVDKNGKPLVKGEKYIVKQNRFGEVIEIEKQ